jgi:hypothetical protein
MTLTTAERTALLITCTACGQATEKPVAWLIAVDDMTCMPCGRPIDLKSANNRTLIQETADNCARIDAALAKLS